MRLKEYNQLEQYFINKAFEDQSLMNRNELNKLIFIAYGWSFVVFETPMFEINFFARKWGEIGVEYLGDENDIILCNEVMIVIDKVWGVYKNISSGTISKFIMRVNSPWDLARNRGYINGDYRIIDEDILHFFNGRLETYFS